MDFTGKPSDFIYAHMERYKGKIMYHFNGKHNTYEEMNNIIPLTRKVLIEKVVDVYKQYEEWYVESIRNDS